MAGSKGCPEKRKTTCRRQRNLCYPLEAGETRANLLKGFSFITEMHRGAAASWEPVGSLHDPGQAGTPVLSPPSHLESRKRQDLKFNTCRNWGTSPLHKASEPPGPLVNVCSHRAPSWVKPASRSCIHSPRRRCHQLIKSFCLSHGMHFLSSSWLAGRVLHMGAGAQVHSRMHMDAGMCRRTERWKWPQQSSANSTDKIVPQIPKAGLGLSNLAPKTAPAYISQARAASLILRNHVLCICICHSDLHRSRLCRPARRWGEGAWCSPPCRGCRRAASPGWPDPAHAMAQMDPKAERSRAACLPAWLLSTGKESLVYLIRFNQPYN